MTTSSLLEITELAGTQEERSVTVNEAIAKLEAVGLGPTCKDVMLDTPPGSPSEGDTYIVGAAPTGAWSGQALDIALYYNGSWRFMPARPGLIAYAENEDSYYRYSATHGWEVFINVTDTVGTTQTDFFSSFIETGADKDYYFAINAPFEMTILSITTRAFGGGTGTLTGDINGTPLGGTANSVSSSEQTQNHASDNVLPAGGDFKVTLAADSPPPTDLAIMIKYTYELAA